MAGTELALPLVGGEINARTISEACTKALEKALTETADAKAFAQRVAHNPALRAAVIERGALIQRLAAPLDPADVFKALAPLVVLYDPPDFGSGKDAKMLQAAWRDQYSNALRNTPREALEHAVSQWILRGSTIDPKRSARFPLPQELLKFAAEKTAVILSAAYKCKVALEVPTSRPPPTQADRDEVRALMADFHARSRAVPAAPAPARPPAKYRTELEARLLADSLAKSAGRPA